MQNFCNTIGIGCLNTLWISSKNQNRSFNFFIINNEMSGKTKENSDRDWRKVGEQTTPTMWEISTRYAFHEMKSTKLRHFDTLIKSDTWSECYIYKRYKCLARLQWPFTLVVTRTMVEFFSSFPLNLVLGYVDAVFK